MRSGITAVVCALVGGLIAHPSASASFLKETGEWVASCDDTGSCSLVNGSAQAQQRSLTPSQFGMSRLCLHQRSNAQSTLEGYLTLRTMASRDLRAAPDSRILRLVPDGIHPDVALRYRGAGHWEIPLGRFDGLKGALLSASVAEVVAPDGRVVERLSLEGLRDAMAGVETAQREQKPVQAGTMVTAPFPLVDPVPAASPAALRLRQDACGAPGLDPSRAYRLMGDAQHADRTLWVTPCHMGIGPAVTLFVIQNADGSAEPMAFPGSSPERPMGRPGQLATAQVDAATGRVREMWRAQGHVQPGQACGILRLWGWTGRNFELAQEHRSLSCTGFVTGYWPRVYHRETILPAVDSASATAAAFRPPC